MIKSKDVPCEEPVFDPEHPDEYMRYKHEHCNQNRPVVRPKRDDAPPKKKGRV